MERMSSKWIIITGMLVAGVLSACEKKNYDERPFPRVLTRGATEISTKGARFHGEMIRGGDTKVTDHGFYWSVRERFSLSSQHISLGPLDKSDFDVFVESALPEGERIYVWAYLQTGDVTVYGNRSSFISKGCNPPEIISMDPQPAAFMQEVSIRGKYFGTSAALVSILISSDVPATYCTDTLIRFKVPLDLIRQHYDLTLSVMGQQEIILPFEIFPPRIDRLSKKEVNHGDTLDIYGAYFKPQIYYQVVRMGGYQCKRLVAETDHIRIIVPYELAPDHYYHVRAIIGEMVAESKDSVFVSQ